jgi:hypothetical protein
MEVVERGDFLAVSKPNISKALSDPRSKAFAAAFTLGGVTQYLADLLFHAAAVLFGSPLQLGFDFLLDIPND